MASRDLKKLLHDPAHLMDSCVRHLGFILPDRLYLTLRYRCLMGKWIDWKNPKTFNEKLQWLKVYNRKPEYTAMVDKAEAKRYAASIIGEEHIIPTLGVWEHFDDIDFAMLPDKFVLKTTNGGGGCGIVICKDKAAFNRGDAKKKLETSLRSSIYRNCREWPYKNIQPKIIAEQFISNSDQELKDYKFFCFSGKARFFKVDFGRFVEHHANYYSPAGELLQFGEAELLPDFNRSEILPDNLDEMIALAERLSTGHKFLRVDLYNTNGKIYFGELTFYPASGLEKFAPEESDMMIGKLLNLN